MAKSENIFSEKEIPAINMRVKQLIEYYTGGSVKQFSEKIKLASSQKLNRIFNIDKRNGEFPEVSSDILIAIANMYSEIDINWVLTGRGKMFLENTNLPPANTSADNTTIQLVNTITSQAETIGSLKKEVEVLQDRIQKLQADVSNSKDEDALNVKNTTAV